MYSVLADGALRSLTGGPAPLTTVTYTTSGSINYSWDTINTSSYMCSKKGFSITSGSISNSNIICAQGDYPANSKDSASNLTLTCPTGTTIKCILFATYGLAGGSCSGDPLKEDPSGSFESIPEAVGIKIIGQTTFALDLTTDMQVNGEKFTKTNVAALAIKKLKILAYCGIGSTTGTTTTGTTTTGTTKLKIHLI